jgi:hypothetical protein
MDGWMDESGSSSADRDQEVWWTKEILGFLFSVQAEHHIAPNIQFGPSDVFRFRQVSIGFDTRMTRTHYGSTPFGPFQSYLASLGPRSDIQVVAIVLQHVHNLAALPSGSSPILASPWPELAVVQRGLCKHEACFFNCTLRFLHSLDDANTPLDAAA